ncbi:MAG TPA: LuxR C-terminal-related transcriptional regulator, partial [Ktedonobacteraceae bacterium]
TQANSQELLETIERSNLFLVPLDQQRRWYRIHDLFRETLLARLHAVRPEMVPILHQRAARWFEKQGEWHDAIFHLLTAGDYSSAASLMEQAAEGMWLQGEIQTLYRWLMMLPDSTLYQHARFALSATLYLLNASASTADIQRARTLAQAEQVMIRIETTLRDQRGESLSASEITLLQRRLRLLRLWLDTFSPTTRMSLVRFRSIEQQMQHIDLEDEIQWQMIPLSVTFILHYTLLQEGGSLVPLLQQARTRTDLSGDRYAMLKVRQWLTLTYMTAGQLRLAYQESLTTLALLEQFAGYTLLKGYFTLTQVLIFYEWNRIDKARAILPNFISELKVWQQLDLLVWASAILIDIELFAGNLSAARQALQDTEDLLQHQEDSYYRSWVETLRVRYWLAEGNLSDASTWAEHVALPEDTWGPLHFQSCLTLLYAYLAQAQYSMLIETIERFHLQLDRPEDNRHLTIECLSLYVVALHKVGKKQQARAIAVRLLALSEPGDYMRIYLEAGETMCTILARLLEAPLEEEDSTPSPSRIYIAQLLKAFAQKKQRPSSNHSPSPLATDEEPALLEPLSGQEHRVLRLLVAGQTYNQMAQALIVSRNTIKTQVSSIYRKLGVNRRTEAIALARRLLLL